MTAEAFAILELISGSWERFELMVDLRYWNRSIALSLYFPMWMFGGVGSLSRYLSLFDTDNEAELVTGMRKAVDQSLERFFSVCRQCSVVGKDDVPDLGLGSESGQVEQRMPSDRVCR